MVESTEIDKDLEFNYDTMKKIILQTIRKSDDVEQMKDDFDQEINSRRKKSMIDSTKALLDVLEDRCVLDCINIESLFVIEKYAKSERLSALITFHQKLLSKYQGKATRPRKISEDDQAFYNIQVKIPDSVKIVIGQSIGNSWIDFARLLDLREGEIDYIDDKFRTTLDKVNQVFQIFENKASLMTYKDVILQGLNIIRRNDLMDKVDKIFIKLANV